MAWVCICTRILNGNIGCRNEYREKAVSLCKLIQLNPRNRHSFFFSFIKIVAQIQPKLHAHMLDFCTILCVALCLWKAVKCFTCMYNVGNVCNVYTIKYNTCIYVCLFGTRGRWVTRCLNALKKKRIMKIEKPEKNHSAENEKNMFRREWKKANPKKIRHQIK